MGCRRAWSVIFGSRYQWSQSQWSPGPGALRFLVQSERAVLSACKDVSRAGSARVHVDEGIKKETLLTEYWS